MTAKELSRRLRRRPVVVSVDTGIDDAWMLAMMLAIGVDIRAVIVSHGNTDIDSAIHNTRSILTLAGRGDIPIIRGAAESGHAERFATHPDRFLAEPERFGGVGGFMEVKLPDGINPVLSGNMVDLIRSFLELDGGVELVNSGPATAMWKVEQAFPGILRRCVTRSYIMAAALDGPGCVGTKRDGEKFGVAEFNVYHDAEAMAGLFASLDRPVLATWDSRGVVFLKSELPNLRPKTPLGKHLVRSLEEFFRLYATDNYASAERAPQVASFDVVLAFAMCDLGEFVDTDVLVTTAGPYYGETVRDSRGAAVRLYKLPPNDDMLAMIRDALDIGYELPLTG